MPVTYLYCYYCYFEVKEAKSVGKTVWQSLLKKKIKNKKKRFFRPTDPNIFRHVTGNTHIFFLRLNISTSC